MNYQSPKELYKNYKKGIISQRKIIEGSLSYIEHHKEVWKRYEAIDYLSLVPLSDRKFIKNLENLIISEENEAIRDKAVLILLKNFPEAALDPIKWYLQQGEFTDFKKSILKELSETFEKRREEILNQCNLKWIKVRSEYFLIPSDEILLKGLNIKCISDIENLESFTNLEILDLSGNSLEILSGIEHFIMLRRVDLSDNKLFDIKSLSQLKNLEYLEISNNEIKDIQDLSYLSNLKYVNLKNNDIKNLKGLEKLKNLKILEIESFPLIRRLCKIIDNHKKHKDLTSPLRDKNLIGEIDKIDWNLLLFELKYEKSVKNIQNIYNLFSKLKSNVFHTFKNKIESTIGSYYIKKYGVNRTEGFYLELLNRYLFKKFSISQIDLVKGYEQSYIDFYDIIEIRNTHVIGITFHELFDYIKGKYLKKFPNLISLTFQGCYISDFSFFVQLKKLVLIGNGDEEIERLSKIKGLKCLKNLKELKISNYNLSNFNGIGSLHNLRRLDLSNNNFHGNVPDIHNLKGLIKLKELILTNNFISDLSGLEELDNLEILNISHQNKDYKGNSINKIKINQLRMKLPNVVILSDIC